MYRTEEFMLESRYLKDNIENIQKLLAIPALKNFETRQDTMQVKYV